jgi:hypothetical protein
MACSDTIESVIGEALWGSLYLFGLTRHFKYPPGPVYASTDQTHGSMQLQTVSGEGGYIYLAAAHWTPLANTGFQWTSMTVSPYGVYFEYPRDSDETIVSQLDPLYCWGGEDSLLLWGQEKLAWGGYDPGFENVTDVLSLTKFVFDPSKLHLELFNKIAPKS